VLTCSRNFWARAARDGERFGDVVARMAESRGGPVVLRCQINGRCELRIAPQNRTDPHRDGSQAGAGMMPRTGISLVGVSMFSCSPVEQRQACERRCS